MNLQSQKSGCEARWLESAKLKEKTMMYEVESRFMTNSRRAWSNAICDGQRYSCE